MRTAIGIVAILTLIIMSCCAYADLYTIHQLIETQTQRPIDGEDVLGVLVYGGFAWLVPLPIGVLSAIDAGRNARMGNVGEGWAWALISATFVALAAFWVAGGIATALAPRTLFPLLHGSAPATLQTDAPAIVPYLVALVLALLPPALALVYLARTRPPQSSAPAASR